MLIRKVFIQFPGAWPSIAEAHIPCKARDKPRLMIPSYGVNIGGAKACACPWHEVDSTGPLPVPECSVQSQRIMKALFARGMIPTHRDRQNAWAIGGYG